MFNKSKRIYIDFQAGSHGNYLEFICNKFLAGVWTRYTHPFDQSGAAHQKLYLTDTVFEANHYTTYGKILEHESVIKISINSQDLLPLQCISLLRAGDHKVDPSNLEFDTYHKLDNKRHRSMLDHLIINFFNHQSLIDGYHAMADPSWPSIKNLKDYEMLPEQIRQECEHLHGIEVNQFSAEMPHCSRHILKEFFRIGFSDPDNHPFMKIERQDIHRNCQVHCFPYAAFYDSKHFMIELCNLANFFNMTLHDSINKICILHQQFLQRQPYKSVKSRCDALVDQLILDLNPEWPNLDVVQEAYIEARLAQNKILANDI